jgi:predicted permease
MYLLVMKQLITMLLIVLSGFIVARCFKVGDKEQKFLSKMLLYFINPCLVVSSFNLEFDALKLKQLGFVAAISLIVHGLMILVGLLFTLSKDEAKRDLNILDRVGTAFTNCGFVGIPLIRGVFGDEGVFYLMGYLIIFNLLIWTYGYHQLSGTINLKKIITNPNIIAVCIGLVIFCLPVTLPEFIAKPVSMIGDLNTATSMILLGILFADFKKPEGGQAKTSGAYFVFRIAKFSAVRLVVCAIVNLIFLMLIFKGVSALQIFACLGNPDAMRMMIFVTLICSMCPAATSISSLACVFDKDTSYASLMVTITSVVCMVTIPMFVALAERVI